MINRLLVLRHLGNQQRLLKFKKLPLNIPKRNSNFWGTQQDIIYRNIGETQDPDDWYLTCFFVAFGVCSWCVTTYMYWDELKLEDPPGLSPDVERFSNEELGIPPDDLGYAPIRPDLIKDGKVIDLGNTLRSEKRFISFAQAVQHLPNQNPYDI